MADNDPYPPGSVAPSIVSGREIYITESAWRELWNYKERLREAIQWVVRDASYKAPEQMGPAMAARWIGRLRSALAGSADETTSVIPEKDNG